MDEKRCIGERGPDKEKREFNPKSLFNLKQYQKSDANLGVNPGVNWRKLGKITLISIVILGICKLYQRKRNSENDDGLNL